MNFFVALFDTFVAPVLAWFTALARTFVANLVALAECVATHPFLVLGAPLVLVTILALITRMENRRRTLTGRADR